MCSFFSLCFVALQHCVAPASFRCMLEHRFLAYHGRMLEWLHGPLKQRLLILRMHVAFWRLAIFCRNLIQNQVSHQLSPSASSQITQLCDIFLLLAAASTRCHLCRLTSNAGKIWRSSSSTAANCRYCTLKSHAIMFVML